MVGRAGFQTLCRLKDLRQIIMESRVIESLMMSLHEKTYTIDRLNMGLNELKYRESGKKQTARKR
jgi:hypothetical protein